jgi:4-amino-4-deoxy-L-arabinose transferase-like glycosyltransferase
MSQNLNVQARDKRDLRVRLSIESVLFFFLLTLIFIIRITNIRYNTLFVDEAIYATVGKNFLSGVSQNATTWMYGSYLYPFISAITNYFTGVIGVRLLSALMTSLAAVIVFQVTGRLFNSAAGLWAMLLFGLAPISINIGQYAVYDAPVVPLLALTGYFLIRAVEAQGRAEYGHLFIAAVCFSIATLSKYFALLYFPSLIIFGVLLYRLRGRRSWPLWAVFVGASGLLLGIYAAFYRRDLLQLLAGNYGVISGQRWTIFKDIWAEMAVMSLLALVGAYWLWRTWSRRPVQHKGRWAALITILVLSFFAAPLYHLIVVNLHSAWKHTVYSLIFLAPLAGYGVASTIESLRQSQRRPRWQQLLGLAVTIGLCVWFLNRSLNRNWGFQHSWPNVEHEVAFLRAQGVNPEHHLLVEGGQIYEYYFDFGAANHSMWQDTWFMQYGNLQGTAAMEAAIRDRWFDFVVLDDYYTPGIRQQLEPVLLSNGYSIGFEESEPLGSGDRILSRIYVRSRDS